MRKLLVVFSVLFSSFILALFDFTSVSAADYSSVCADSSVSLEEGYIRRCGNNYIYIDMNNKDKSSYFVSTNSIDSNLQLLYVGDVDGVETFYSYGFYYFGTIYDERNFEYYKGDYWTSISIDGVRIYDGKFEDSWFLNNTKNERMIFYNEKGEYLIHQYANGKAYKTVKVIVVSEKDYDMSINSIKYGDKVVGVDSLVVNDSDLVIDIGKNKYGYEKNADISVNECEISTRFSNNLVVDNSKFQSCLIHNGNNKLDITLYNGFGKKKVFKYSFYLASEKITIDLENSVSEMVTSSRRILINAKSGLGKELDSKYNLYYWSENPNHDLTYESFMSNYESSEYKGNYSSSKGVILRDTEGTYYLYALAKDEDSSLVVRSDEYVLKKSSKINKVIIDDVIIVFVLGVLAIAPIAVYLIIRVKDTY